MNSLQLLEKHCSEISSDVYNQAYEKCLEQKDREDYCLMPIATTSIVVMENLPKSFWVEAGKNKLRAQMVVSAMANQLAYCGQWRLTKDIVQIDPDVLAAIIDTQISDKIPDEILYRLPSYCMFVEYPTELFIGFFVALEKSPEDVDTELRIWWMRKEGGTISTQFHLGNYTIEDSLKRAEEYTRQQIGNIFDNLSDSYIKPVPEKLLHDAMNIVLYLCSQNAEYSPTKSRPSRPTLKKTKRGLRFFPADRPRIWDVGKSAGDTIREAKTDQKNHSSEKRPHIRRSHWHGYWSGPMKGKRTFNLKWMPPILVGIETQ